MESNGIAYSGWAVSIDSLTNGVSMYGTTKQQAALNLLSAALTVLQNIIGSQQATPAKTPSDKKH
jgi:hypothetical protein